MLSATDKPSTFPATRIGANTVASQRGLQPAAPQGDYRDHVTPIETVLDMVGQDLTEPLVTGNDEDNGPSAGVEGSSRYRSPHLPTTSPTPTQEGRPAYSPEQLEADEAIQGVMKRVDTSRSRSARERAEALQQEIECLRIRVRVSSAVAALVLGPGIYSMVSGATSANPWVDPLTYFGFAMVVAGCCTWFDAFVKCADGKLDLPEAARRALEAPE